MKKKKEFGIAEVFCNIGFCLKFLYRVNKKQFFIRIPNTLLASVSVFIPIVFVRQILNEITVGKDVGLVILYVLGMVAITLGVNMLSSYFTKLDNLEFEKTMYEIKRILADYSMNMKYSDLENPRVKDFISLASGSNCFYEVLTYSTGLLSAFLNSAGLIAIIVTIQPLVLFLMFAVVVVQVITDKKMRKFQYFWRRDTATMQRKMNYLVSLATETRFGKEIRANGLEQWVCGKIDRQFQDEIFPASNQNRKAILRFNSFTEVSGLVQQAAVYLYLAYRVVFKGMLIGDFSMYMTSIEKFADFIGGLVGNYSLLMGNGMFVREFRYCMTLSNAKDGHVRREYGALPERDFQIEFKNVSFRYPNTERMILKNINITLFSGETLSIVGLNGAGKSTFVKLLCRFYEPTEGEICINGVPVQYYPYDRYVDLISVVFQDYKLFSFTVKDNIVLGGQVDEPRLARSIEQSGLREKIASLPRGVDTMVDKQFDPEGVEFSGGEGQKLAIARAIYKNTPVAVLDEPTSALDPIAEYDIYHRFFSLSRGKCAVYISHRLSATRFTDKIAVFDDGFLKEYGSHKDLIALENGIYKGMFQTQAQYYH